MKIAGVIVLAVLIVTLLVSGCVQETGPPTTGRLTQEQVEQQAFNTLEQEMDESLEGMTLEELENELLQQG